MPIARFEMPDGRIGRFEVPEGTTPEQAQAMIAARMGGKPATPDMNSPAFKEKAAAQEAADRERYNPTSGMSPFERFRAGMGKAMVDAGRGVGQLVGLTSDADIAESRQLDAPLENTTGGKVGNIAGTVATFAPTAMIPGANTVLGAGLIGGLSSALMTPGSGNERATAGIFGAGGGMAGQALPQVIRTVKAAAEPLTEAGRAKIIGRVMQRAAGDNAADVAARLTGAQSLVPGSAPTAAEVAESGGIAALQRAMSAADPETYAHRGMQQSSARVQALRDIAKDGTARSAAVAARDAASDPIYTAAKAVNVPVDAQLKSIIDRLPKGTIERATDLARIEGRSGQMPMGEQLHYVKMALDSALDNNPANAISRTEKAAVMGVKNDLLAWMDNAIPEYGQARQAFSAASRPINQMDVGSALLDRLRGPLADHGALASETGATLARALRGDGESLARNATGFRQGIGDVLSAQQMDSVNAVAADLARKANAQNLGRGVGSNTFQNFAMDNLSSSMGMPSAVSSALGAIPGLSATGTLVARGTQAVGKMAYKSADEAIRQQMAQALLNPQAAGALLESAIRPSALAKALQSLPPQVQRALPPEEILRLLQSAPGVIGAGVGASPARQ